MVRTSFNKQGTLIADPGKTYRIVFDLTQKDHPFSAEDKTSPFRKPITNFRPLLQLKSFNSIKLQIQGSMIRSALMITTGNRTHLPVCWKSFLPGNITSTCGQPGAAPVKPNLNRIS